jgi:NAD(P)-dependent dehydrogenase (short-subunit alcohol dehydrogenase family)
MQCDLGDRVAFVTGAANGIGKATAKRLSENGACVVIADVDAAGARAVAATLPRGLAVTVDITDEAAVARAVATTVDVYGRLDILINNAGVNSLAHRVDIDAFPRHEWDRIIAIDLDGLFRVTRQALPPMLAAGAGGRIVNIASVVGLVALRLQSPFVAAKAGVIHLTRSMALELGPKGVLVNAVAPGSVMTELTAKLFYDADGVFQARTKAFMDHVPLGRPAIPDEIAEAVLFLCAPETTYITGQVLTVDGGWTAGFLM